MKQAQSNLLEQFLHHVERGLIQGRDDSSGQAVLLRMAEALQAVQAGVDPDQALGIERAPGQPRDGNNVALAYLVHEYRKAGDKWATVELLANDWLRNSGRETLSLPRLKAIYKQHVRAIEQREQVAAMIARINGI